MQSNADSELVKVNVSGRVFELTRGVLNEIPMLATMIKDWHGDGPLDAVIPLYRSARVFEHVLSYVQDRNYPFPAKYVYELDYLGVSYNRDSLYTAYKEAITALELHNKQQTDELLMMYKSIDALQSELKWLKTGVYTCVIAARHKYYLCQKECGYVCWPNSISCNGSCKRKCMFNPCKEKSQEGNNYCPAHESLGEYCIKRGCWRLRVDKKSECCLHDPYYQ